MTPVDAAAEPVRRRKRSKKLPRHPYDRRRALGRRITALVRYFRERLGPDADDPVTNAAVMRCAEVTALAEHHRAKMLRGERVSTETVLRLSRTADLLTRKLGLDHRKPQPVGPSLADIMCEQP
jgi:hypothetical protein